MKNITNYINMAINFSILGLLIYLTIAIMDIKKSIKKNLKTVMMINDNSYEKKKVIYKKTLELEN